MSMTFSNRLLSLFLESQVSQRAADKERDNSLWIKSKNFFHIEWDNPVSTTIFQSNVIKVKTPNASFLSLCSFNKLKKNTRAFLCESIWKITHGYGICPEGLQHLPAGAPEQGKIYLPLCKFRIHWIQMGSHCVCIWGQRAAMWASGFYHTFSDLRKRFPTITTSQ